MSMVGVRTCGGSVGCVCGMCVSGVCGVGCRYVCGSSWCDCGACEGVCVWYACECAWGVSEWTVCV